jgi:two-component system chemotaxis response regulator CheY
MISLLAIHTEFPSVVFLFYPNQKIILSKTILVVDDCEITREMISLLLEEYEPEPEVVTGESGKDGLDKLANNEIDLILSDVMMPEMDGYEFVAEVRKLPEHANIPVIMLTDLSEIKDMQKGKAAGANAWLKKPVERDRMYELLDKHLG